MTFRQLMELTSEPFDGIALCEDSDDIFLAVPIPSPWGDGLRYFLNEDGQFEIEGSIEEWKAAWAQYIATLKPKRHNRTRKQAEEQGNLLKAPKKLVIPTYEDYEHSMATINDGKAYLQPIIGEISPSLRFENGKLYFNGLDARGIDLVQYYDMTPKAVYGLNTELLQCLYSFIYQHIEEMSMDADTIIQNTTDPQFIGHSYKIYINDILKNMGYAQNHSKDSENNIVTKIINFSLIIGLMEENDGGRTYQNKYPVMQLIEHNAAKNYVIVTAPYINKLIMTIMQKSIRMDKHNNPLLNKNGTPRMYPSHSFLIHSDILSADNKPAFEIVREIVILIEQTGSDGLPHIKYSNLIDRCSTLKLRLEATKTTANKNNVLRRAFSKAWELLRTHTDLEITYDGINLPTDIPTVSLFNDTLEIRHKGKTKKKKSI